MSIWQLVQVVVVVTVVVEQPRHHQLTHHYQGARHWVEAVPRLVNQLLFLVCDRLFFFC